MHLIAASITRSPSTEMQIDHIYLSALASPTEMTYTVVQTSATGDDAAPSQSEPSP